RAACGSSRRKPRRPISASQRDISRVEPSPAGRKRSAMLGEDMLSSYEDGAVAYNRGDYAAARRLWLPLAEAGHADAQTMLGTIYEEGHGVSRDYAAAVTWYHRAADQGHSDAQFYLACMHDLGKGVTLDPAAAAQWLTKAADQGPPLVISPLLRDALGRRVRW